LNSMTRNLTVLALT